MVDIVTGNIEGVKSNTSFLQSLATNNRISCIQEHFLWDFETDFLCKILPNFDNLTRCYDSNDPLDGSKLPRGQGGYQRLNIMNALTSYMTLYRSIRIHLKYYYVEI